MIHELQNISFSLEGILDQIVLERLPERYIIPFEIPDGFELQYDNTDLCTEWEWVLRSIKRIMQRRGYPPELFRRVSTAVSYENVLKGVDSARAKKLDPCGDFYEDVICRWPTLFGQDGNMLFRLMLQVRRPSAETAGVA